MEQQYYIRLRGRVQGPFPADKLRALARRGKFSRHHHISVDRTNWEPASKYPELFPDPGPPKIRRSAVAMELAESSADMEDGELETAASTDQADQEWYYTRDGQELGPVTMARLQLLASTGKLTYEDYLWTDGMPNWVSASTVPGVFPELDSYSDDFEPAVEARLPHSQPHGGGPQRMAPMAVASFVLGLLGGSLLFFLGSILAVVFGHIALKQIKESENQLGGRGLALSGLILGYIVVIASVVVGIVVVSVIALRDMLV